MTGSDRFADIAAGLRERFPEAVTAISDGLDMGVVTVRPDAVVDVCTALRDDHGYGLLADLSCVDWLPATPRFNVHCHLYSLEHNDRVRVKVELDGDAPAMPTLSPVWPAADYQEREVYDFFGITFTGHPNMQRVFMPPDWVGHPQRKDYAVGGVPVEYRIEPAYIGDRVVSNDARPAAGGLPGRLQTDRGRRSSWTWSGDPASGVRLPVSPAPEGDPE